MYKLLIVDDEQVEREGLKAILHKHMPDLEIELAKHGSAAIEQVQSSAPDLILMDIKMPGISGLEAVKRIQETHPRMKFIMVTAYDTFEYARTALKLGVSDYLLKPSKAADIVETVTSALQEIALERAVAQQKARTARKIDRMMPIVEADVVTQLLYDHVHDVHLEELIPLIGGARKEASFVLLLTIGGQQPLPRETFFAALREKLRQQAHGWVGALSGRQIPIIVFREQGRSYRAQAASIVHHLFTLQAQNPSMDFFIGIGGPVDALREIRQSYQEALIAAADSAVPVKYRYYEDTPAIHDLKEDFPGKDEEQQFMEMVRTGRWHQVHQLVMDFIDRYERNGFPLIHSGQRVLEVLWVVARVLLEAGIETDRPTLSFRMHSYRELRGEIASLLEKLEEAARTHASRIEPDVAQRLKQYIREHSHEDLSLDELAAMVDLSPFYISRIFKEEMGINYIDFLTACRIEKAKTLLAGSELSLKEITFKVGYHDPNYFSKVFKKVEGISPSDYRKTIYTPKKSR